MLFLSFFFCTSALTFCREILDEIDREILNIGHHVRDPRLRPHSSSAKGRRSCSSSQPLYEYCFDFEDTDTDNGGDEDDKEPARKKPKSHKSEIEAASLQTKTQQASRVSKDQSRAQRKVQNGKSGKLKNKPRRIPVNELVVMSERCDSHDMSSGDGRTPLYPALKSYECRFSHT